MLPSIIRPSVAMNASTTETTMQPTDMNSTEHQCVPAISWPARSLSGWNPNMLSALPMTNPDIFGLRFPMNAQYMQFAADFLARSSIERTSTVACNRKTCQRNYSEPINKKMKTEGLTLTFQEKTMTELPFAKAENSFTSSPPILSGAMTNYRDALDKKHSTLSGPSKMQTSKPYCLQTTSLPLDTREGKPDAECLTQPSVTNKLSTDEECNSTYCNSESKTHPPEKPFLKFGVQAILSQVQSPLPLKNSQSFSSNASHVPFVTNEIHSPFGVPPYSYMNTQLSLGSHYLPPLGSSFLPWFPQSMRGKNRRGMLRRAVFSDAQRKTLEKTFQQQKYIGKPDRKKLATKLGLKDSQVKIWFQNRRMKWRNSKERQILIAETTTSFSSSATDEDVKRSSCCLEESTSSTTSAQNNPIIASPKEDSKYSENVTLLKSS